MKLEKKYKITWLHESLFNKKMYKIKRIMFADNKNWNVYFNTRKPYLISINS